MFETFKDELSKAVIEYGDEHVDITKNEETGKIYGTYHSRHDSFPVTKEYPESMATKSKLIELCKNLNIGYSF